MGSKNLKCILFGHKFCKCGWCIKHPVCRRCFWDRNCNSFHSGLRDAVRCQHDTYDFLQLRGVLDTNNVHYLWE